jgi:hypothetical protein
VNAPAAEAVALSVSLYVTVSVVPLEARLALTIFGAVTSAGVACTEVDAVDIPAPLTALSVIA